MQPADSQRAGRQGGAGGGRLQRRDTRLRGHHQVHQKRPRDRPSVGFLQVSSQCYVLCVAHVILTCTNIIILIFTCQFPLRHQPFIVLRYLISADAFIHLLMQHYIVLFTHSVVYFYYFDIVICCYFLLRLSVIYRYNIAIFSLGILALFS